MNIIIRKIAFKSAKFTTQIEKIISECYKNFKIIVDQIKHSRQLMFTDDFKINYYLFQAFYGDLAKILMVLLISLVLNTFVETLIVIVSFAGLRFLTGGYHAKTYESCFVITVSIYTLAGIFSKYLLTMVIINNIMLIAVTIILMILLILYAPKFLTEVAKESKRRYKYYSIGFTLSCYSLSFVLGEQLILPIYSGILIQCFTITTLGYKILNWIDMKVRKMI